MRYFTHVVRTALALGLGLTVVALIVVGFSAANAAGQVDLTVDANTPAHVAPGATFIVNIAYANIGAEPAPDARITATLPDGVQFITATDRWGASMPPDITDANTLAWNVGAIAAGSCCNHILISEQADANLAEGTALTNTIVIATTAIESDTTNNTASTVSVVCDMAGSVKQVHASEVMPGDVLTYTIVLSLTRRAGGLQEIQERWIELTDTLPFSHQVRFLGWSGQVSGTHDGQSLRWQGRLRAGEPLTLQYRLGVEGVITPGAVITNMAQLGWSTGHMQLGPVTTVVTLPHHARMIGPNGDEWHHEYGVTLTVPPGAVTQTTRFEFKPLFTDTRLISGPPGLIFAHRAFELTAFRFGENVHQFGQPLTFTVGISDTDMARLKRETLRLWTRSGPGEPWAMLGEPVRVMSGTLVFTTTHFSQFALFGQGAHRVFLPLAIR